MGERFRCCGYLAETQLAVTWQDHHGEVYAGVTLRPRGCPATVRSGTLFRIVLQRIGRTHHHLLTKVVNLIQTIVRSPRRRLREREE